MNPWPHQVYAISEVEKAISAGHKRILLVIPTGGGKTFCAAELIKIWREEGHRTALYTNRRLLVTQLSDMLDGFGITHGIRARGHKEELDLDVQICSIQTEQSKGRKAKKMMGEHVVHNCQRVVVDEAHLNASGGMLEIMGQHIKEWAIVLGLTATPIDLGHAYEVLIQAGRTSELRDCGALIPALHFGPDEPDLHAFKKLKKSLAQIGADTAEITEGQARDMIMTPTIFGRVWEWFEKLNPDIDGRRPSILFAPGVRESLWFCEQFEAKGVRAAHIDGANIWVDGELHRTTQKLRQEVLDGSKEGRIGVLCNRFVLREGIDAPWLAYGIFATVFGSLQTYLQSGGRLLRSCSGLAHVTVQDHGGNWWRYGSLNADREWLLDRTGVMIQGMRADALREKREDEPFRCPQCAMICIRGRCVGCGWIAFSPIKSRPVVGTDGELRMMQGDIYRRRTIYARDNGPKRWQSMYYRSRTDKGSRTFRAAEALFASENNWCWPDKHWPLMPVNEEDRYRLVRDVPFERLVPKEKVDDREIEESNAQGKN